MLFLIINDQYGSDVPMAIVKADSNAEAVQRFWDSTSGGKPMGFKLFEAAGCGEKPQIHDFAALELDLESGFVWIGALS